MGTERAVVRASSPSRDATRMSLAHLSLPNPEVTQGAKTALSRYGPGCR